MFRFISIGIDMICAGIVLVPCMLILQSTVFRQMGIRKKVLTIIFGLYLTAVFSAVGIPNIKFLTVELTFNWIPFIDIVNGPAAYLKNTGLNILLFVPLGCLVTVIWGRTFRLKETFILGVLLSLAIELLQIFSFRLTDVDDLITNTAGTVLGYYIGKVICSKQRTSAETGPDIGKSEIFIILGLAFAVMFFAEPFLSGAFWSVVM